MGKTYKRLLAFALGFVMILSMMPVSAFAAFDYAHNEAASSDDYYDIISKKDWDIAPGITETEIVLNNQAGDRRQVVHLMQADISNPYTRVISSYTNMDTSNYAISTIPEHAAFIEEEWGENVVGAMNTCLSWYNSAAYAQDPSRVNEPLGFMMVDGEVYFDHSVGFPTCIVIHKDTNENGEARPSNIPKVEMRTVTNSENLNGWEDQVIPCSSGYIVKDGVNQHKSDHGTGTAARSVVGVKADGSVVIMMNDGRQSPYSLGMTMYECAEVMIAAGCVYAANCDGGGSSTFMSQRPGEELAVNCSPCDGSLRQNTHGIIFISTAPATGEFDNAYLSTENDYFVPGSKVEVKAVGRDFSGAEAEIPAEVVWTLADESFGTVENGVFTSNGKVGDVTVQLIYNDEVVGSKTIHIVNPEEIYFTQSSTVIPYGKSIVLDMKAMYGEFEVVYTAEDFEWVLSDTKAGTIDGLNFQATNDTTKTSVRVSATYKHADKGTITLDIMFGKGSEVLYDFEDGDISEWLGKDAAVAWAKENNPNSPVLDASPLGSNFSAAYDTDTFLATAENGKVKNGNYALGVELDYSNGDSFGQWTYNMFFNVGGQKVLRDTANGMNATRLGMWIYIPEELAPGHNLAMQTELYAGASSTDYARKNTHLTLLCNGKTLTKCTEEDIPEDRWVYCYMDLTPYNYVAIQNPYESTAQRREPQFIRFYTQSKEPHKSILYIDDITLDYSDAVDDRNAPVISNLTVNTSGTAIRSFNASVADYAASNASGLNYTSAKIYVDGVALSGVTASGNTMSAPDVTLTAGKHTVTFEITDNKGNTTKESTTFTVEGTASLTVDGHNDQNKTPEYDSVYYVDIKVADISMIEAVTMDVQLNHANSWELNHMVVAEGFEATYTLNKNHNIATITVEKTGDVDNTATVLVSIPVRVWSYDAEAAGVAADKIGANSYPKVLIKANVCKGDVTFADGAKGTFGGSINVATAVTESVLPTNWHAHTAQPIEDLDATCTEAGYTGRTYCAGCASVVEWGTTDPAMGHDWKVNAEGKLACANGGELLNGVHTDGKTYVDGVVIADGWVEVDGVNTYYYQDGVMLTGSHLIDGAMYTFNEDGTYLPDYKYDGWFEINDTVMYFVGNNYVTGYHKLDGKYCYFDKNGFALDGIVELCGTECLFDNGVSVPTETVTLAGLCGEDAAFVIHKDGHMVVDGNGPMTDYTNIGLIPWFEESIRTSVKELTIGKGLTTVGVRAFFRMSSLKKVTFEEGSKMFRILTLGFARNTSLETIVIPEGVNTLNVSAFYNCTSLKSVYLPKSVYYILDSTFEDCPNATFYVPANSRALELVESYGYKYEIYAVENAGGKDGNITWSLNSDGVLEITGNGAMPDYAAGTAPWNSYADQITTVKIAEGVTNVGKFSFYNCKALKNIELASTVTTIGWGAFGYCSGLETVTIPDTVKTIDGYAFYYCTALKTVIISENSALASIGEYAFRNDAALESEYIPNDTTIGTAAFYACGKVTLSVQENSDAHKFAVSNKVSCTVRPAAPKVLYSGECGEDAAWELYNNGVLKITGTGKMADWNAATAPWQSYVSQITSVEIGEGITYVGKFNFYGCNALKTITFSSTVETIGWGAFGYCSALENVVIPANVKTVMSYAFYNCEKLASVTFAQGSELVAIERYAFLNDAKLNNVVGIPANTNIDTYAFYGSGYSPA